VKDREKKKRVGLEYRRREQIRETGGSERKEERRKGKSFSIFLYFLF